MWRTPQDGARRRCGRWDGGCREPAGSRRGPLPARRRWRHTGGGLVARRLPRAPAPIVCGYRAADVSRTIPLQTRGSKFAPESARGDTSVAAGDGVGDSTTWVGS